MLVITSRLRVYSAQLFLFITFLLLITSEGGPKSRPKSKGKSGGSSTSGRNRKSSDFSTGITYTLIALGLCLLPAIGVFLYNLYNDPLTPELLRRAVSTLQRRTLGYLAPSKFKQTKAS